MSRCVHTYSTALAVLGGLGTQNHLSFRDDGGLELHVLSVCMGMVGGRKEGNGVSTEIRKASFSGSVGLEEDPTPLPPILTPGHGVQSAPQAICPRSSTL